MKNFVILCLLLFPLLAHGQTRTTIAFWNCENLYDTIPSLFYDDGDYTPSGAKHWNTARYQTKLTALVRVIDEIGADIIGLAEVENETVVRDLVIASNQGYNYIHRTSSDRRGIDLALLYHGDRFFPQRIELVNSGFGREFLHVAGVLDTLAVSILVVHLPSQLNEREFRQRAFSRLAWVVDSLQHINEYLIVMGDFNDTPRSNIFRNTFDRLTQHQTDYIFSAISSNGGSYAYRGHWQLFDNILLTAPFNRRFSITGGVFVRDYMLVASGRRRGYPRRTFYGSRYEGGASDHLPVYVQLI